MKIKMLFLILIFFIIFNTNAGENKKEKKICILYFKTKYKIELLKKLKERLNKEGFDVKHDLIKNINKYDPNDFSAVIILSGVAIFTPSPRATKYIKKHNYAEKYMLFFYGIKYLG